MKFDKNPSEITMRKFLFKSPAILFLLLMSCGGEWVSGNSSTVSCDLSDILFGTPKRMVLSGDGDFLYVLDRFDDVYAYSRNRARTCAFEPLRTSENPDAKIPVNMASELAIAGSFLYYYDGISILRSGDADWECDVSLNAFAATPSYLYYAPSVGLQKVKMNSTGCVPTGTSFSATRVLAVDEKSSSIATAETSGALSDPPQRISVYDADGNVRFRAALASGDSENSLHFCSATRIRLGAAFLALLDAKCGYLGVFNLSGGLEHRLKLSEIGVRNPVDMDIVDDDLYILSSSSIEPLYFLDLASYAFGEE